MLYGQRVNRRCRTTFALRREVAWILDYGLLLTLLMLCAVIVDQLVGMPAKPGSDRQAALGFFIIFAPIVSLVVKDSIRGVSPGKLLMGLRVVDKDTRAPIGPLQSIKRNMILLVPFMPIVLAVMMRGGPRLGDGWANTRVILRRRPSAPAFLGNPRASPGWDLSSSEGWR